VFETIMNLLKVGEGSDLWAVLAQQTILIAHSYRSREFTLADAERDASVNLSQAEDRVAVRLLGTKHLLSLPVSSLV
jgi:hypothetical protein